MEKLEKFQLLLACTIISTGILLSSFVFATKIDKNENITVTGSASKIVKSDSASLTFAIRTNAINQKEAFSNIKKQSPKVVEYLISKEIKKEDIDIKAINGYYNYKTNQNGYSTNEIIGYSANQSYSIKSNDVEKIKHISTDIQSLVDKWINLEIYSTEYFYSDLASIKIDLLNEASKDAKQRANSMLKATGASVGRVKSMKMGVFQITPPTSNNVSDMGFNDTTSIDKKVTAVANVVFKVK